MNREGKKEERRVERLGDFALFLLLFLFRKKCASLSLQRKGMEKW